ncbi:hypothetical protein F53441_8674 [Fusarium austroafricanum]|uniref:2EXR domain-containing protein n=1 Tax=Fusarium austroafricanum TaxID=2364996 RepID=A0A8H4NR09_9HYPO|nr:hypothetical protein F53441_8674 [Fusarium austroafricanum]
MALSFPKFRALPREIREEIWKFATRPDEPGVHYFSISRNEQYSHSKNLKNAVIPKYEIPNIILSAPNWFIRSADHVRYVGTERDPASWRVNNPSLYLFDSGLWTACKESRMVMRKHYRLSYWKEVRENTLKRSRRAPCSHSEMMPELIHFRDKESRDQYAIIYPQRDIFVLQAETLDFTWMGLENHTLAAPSCGFGGIDNLAIEYNQRWASCDKEFIGLMAKRLIDIASEAFSRRIWFVDYRIRRKILALTESQALSLDLYVFHQQGRRFVRVDEHESESPWNIEYEVAEGRLSSCKHFVRRLREEADKKLQAMRYENMQPLDICICACEEN